MDLVAGGGGFIGGALVRYLLNSGVQVRSVDAKNFPGWWQLHEGAENLNLDLREPDSCARALSGVSRVWNLAADMGGMGYIESHKSHCMTSVLINTNLLRRAAEQEIERFFFSSSACVYPGYLQREAAVKPLKESDAYPADPEDGYGWEKLFSERMCRHYSEDFGIQTRVARFHNVYGPMGTFQGGREKAPAAICRKIAEAKISGSNEIEIWGDGNQLRSFMFISDCIEGSVDLMESDYSHPVNIGSAETVSINDMVSIVEKIANIRVRRNYRLEAPQGVRGRSSDNTLFESLFGWEPSTSLMAGLEMTFSWIYNQLLRKK